jgi:hypothetical protein
MAPFFDDSVELAAAAAVSAANAVDVACVSLVDVVAVDAGVGLLSEYPKKSCVNGFDEAFIEAAVDFIWCCCASLD